MLLRKWASLLAVLCLILQAGLAVSHGPGRSSPVTDQAAIAADLAANGSGDTTILAASDGALTWVICQSGRSDPARGPGKHGKMSPCPICASISVAWVLTAAPLPAVTQKPSRMPGAIPREGTLPASLAVDLPQNRGPPTLIA